MSDSLLGPLTTLGVGGPAEQLVAAHTEDELIDALRREWDRGADPLVIAGGSNLFISDEGFPGTAILVRTMGMQRLDAPSGRVRLRIAAGEIWDSFVQATVEAGWSGVEALSGIPGSVGAAPIQNIGAYGQDVSGVVLAVRVLDRDSGEVETLTAAELELGYRTSILKHHGGEPPERDAVVLSVDVELIDDDARSQPVRYAQLAGSLGIEVGETSTVAAVRAAVLSLRASKGMVLDSTDPDTRSAGSFFTNPIVSSSVAAALPESAPRWPVTETAASDRIIPLTEYDGGIPPIVIGGEARVKLSAAWLIEHAGLPKGYGLPRSRAALSTKHTLALTNTGGATAAEVAELARFVALRVRSEFGVTLVAEPVTVGIEL